MLSISKIESLWHGLDYYSQDNYYSKEDQKEFTQWYGKAAKMLGLEGDVKFEEFKKALIGVSDKGKFASSHVQKEDEVLIAREKLNEFKDLSSHYIKNLNIADESKVKIQNTIENLCKIQTQINKSSLENYQKNMFSIINKETNISIDEKTLIKNELRKQTEFLKKPPSRRSGYDLTFSAPKSVSLAALVGGDKKILEAHREAVQAALAIVEKEYSQTRVRQYGQSEREIEVTGKIAVATFEHDVSRKTDPQLHTHCVLMNFTKRDDGSWRSIHQDGFFYNSKKIGSIYQNELAKRIQNLGYEIKLNPNGTFDMKGYSEDQLRQFSKRTEQLKELGAQTQKQATRIIKKNRDKKNENIPRDVLYKKWKDEANSVGIKHPEIKIYSDFKKDNKKNSDDYLNEVIINSVKDLTDKEVIFKKSFLEAAVLGKTLGQYEYKEVVKKLDVYLEENTQIVGTKNVPEYVPNHILALEKESIALMQRGKDTFDSILSLSEARIVTDNLHKKSIESGHKDGLNAGQREAIEVMLTANDRIYAWQGVAGAGKSFSLGSASKIATEKGYTVRGFAPAAEAAKNLAAEAKLSEAHTVASLLVKETSAGRAKGKEIWIVDEAGLLSAADAHALLKKAEIENARVLLVGDTRQLSSVGAGNPFKQLQSYGMKTAQLTQGVRQLDDTMKNSINLIAANEHKKGLEILDQSGKIFEIKNSDEIILNMAKDYLSLSQKDLKESLFISSTNHEKEEITNIVRAELKSRGELQGTIKTNSYVSLDYNEHALKSAHVYSVGDILIPNRRSQGLKSNQVYVVQEINHKKNTVTVCSEGNTSFKKEINVSKLNCNLFREEEIEISVGDRIKWTKNHVPNKLIDVENNTKKVEKRLNGEYLTVKEIDPKTNRAVFEYEKGRLENIDLSKKQFLDYSYVTTVFSSQGKTCDKVYASLTNVDRENFYVATSRARYDCKLYTKDKEKLYEKVEKIGANITAHEKLQGTKKDHFKMDIINDLFSKKVNFNDDKSKINFKEFSDHDHHLSGLNRKVKEHSLEVIHQLGLDPEKENLTKFYKFGKTNQEIVSKMFYYRVNGLYGIETKDGHKQLSVQELVDAKTKLPDLISNVTREVSQKLNLTNTLSKQEFNPPKITIENKVEYSHSVKRRMKR